MAVRTFPSIGATGPESKVIAWTGFAIDSRDSSVYSAANGGHGDYAGNEVNQIRLSDDAPAWTERRAATAASQTRENSTHYADGRPTSRHTYYGIAFNEQRGRVMILAGSRWGDGGHVNAMDGFDVGRNDWDGASSFPSAPSPVTAYYGAAVVEHKANGDLYVFANYRVFRWSSAANAWSTVVGSGGMYGFESAAALDTRRNRVLVAGGLGNDRGLYSLGTSSMQTVTLTGSAAGAIGGEGHGMVYDPWLDAYLVRPQGSGGTVYRVDAQSFVVTTLATTGGGAIPSSRNGVYRRFLHAPGLGGVAYSPSYDGNMWFLRTV